MMLQLVIILLWVNNVNQPLQLWPKNSDNWDELAPITSYNYKVIYHEVLPVITVKGHNSGIFIHTNI